MGTITEALKKGKILVSDGAWGTFLLAKGLKAGECPELWNLEHPEEVFNIARSYIEAGSNMVETNSFGGSSIKLAHYGLQDKAYELNKAAASISRKAAGPDHYVLGSIGPTGKILMMGEITQEELFESFSEQARGLEDGKADAIIIETMSDIEEARTAIKAARSSTDLEVICTMTFEKTKTGEFRTMMGISPSDMVLQLKSEKIDIIGANCGNGFEDMIGIVREIRNTDPDIPILVHANAGIPVYQDGQTVFPETPEQMASYVQNIIDAGANIIGGCCGTTPAHISKLKGMIKL
ncbi:MAG: homocysteine S-methyltransferase family protein [Cyclobacteriaceae bacterium]|jgi:5-methyltetrahydrofolate--homocysteine methyltransferase